MQSQPAPCATPALGCTPTGIVANATSRFPALGFPLSDVTHQKNRLTSNQRHVLRDAVKKLTVSQRRHARFTLSGFEGGPPNILVVFVVPTEASPYHESFMVLSLTHCNIAYDPGTAYIFATTGC
jgi:hypothetical protein